MKRVRTRKSSARRRHIATALVVLAVFLFFLGPVVRIILTKVAPLLLGAPVEMGLTIIDPIRGLVSINDLVVGNPEGYKSDHIFECHRFKLNVDWKSLRTGTLEIESILISGLDVCYERSLLGSNLKDLLEKLERKSNDEKSGRTKNDKKRGGIIVRQVVLENMDVTVATTATGGHGVVLPLDRMELRDLGAEDEVLSPSEVVFQVISAIGTGVSKSLAKNTVKLAGAGIDLGVAGVELGIKGATALGKGIVGLFKDDEKPEEE